MRRLPILFLALAILFSCTSPTEEEPLDLKLSTESVSVDADAAEVLLSLESNTSWMASSEEAWVELSKQSGQGNEELKIVVERNPRLHNRTAKVTLSITGMTRQFLITQEGLEEKFRLASIAGSMEGMRPLSSKEFSQLMGQGWNLGNTLDAIGGETAWGNPKASLELMQTIRSMGFESVRIPVAWSQLGAVGNYTIQEAWLDRVEEVVNYALDAGLIVVLNNHWDGGWMQPTFLAQDSVNEQLAYYWYQIALRFRDYDDRLLFAGSNEVMVTGNYGAPTAENIAVQNGFNDVFVQVVRMTGGRNANRHLVIQSYNTNLDYAVQYLQIPKDSVVDKLMVEVHYYDPWEFSLREDYQYSQWGQAAIEAGKKAPWGDETYVEIQLEKLKSKFLSQNIPVLIGEFGAIDKSQDPGNAISRRHYLSFLSHAIQSRGMIPFYWDNGHVGEFGFALLNRNTLEVLYPDLVQALTGD